MTATEIAENRWNGLAEALLLGFVALATLLHQSFVQGAGFVPVGASQLMMWVAVVGIVGYVALRRVLTAGYWLASLTGLLYLAFIGLIFSGALGPLPEGGPVIGLVLGPIAQGAYAVVLIAVTYGALRERGSQSDVHERDSDVTAQSQ
jgi:hypothetical protein